MESLWKDEVLHSKEQKVQMTIDFLERTPNEEL